MLWDPRWEVKADPFSLESLIEWLEKKPAGETYCYTAWGECLIGQWLKSIDPEAHSDPYTSGFWYNVNGVNHNFDQYIFIAAGDVRRFGKDWTFGKALERARHSLKLKNSR